MQHFLNFFTCFIYHNTRLKERRNTHTHRATIYWNTMHTRTCTFGLRVWLNQDNILHGYISYPYMGTGVYKSDIALVPVYCTESIVFFK